MSKHHGSAPGGKADFSPGHILGLFLFYAVLASGVLGLHLLLRLRGGEASPHDRADPGASPSSRTPSCT